MIKHSFFLFIFSFLIASLPAQEINQAQAAARLAVPRAAALDAAARMDAAFDKIASEPIGFSDK